VEKVENFVNFCRSNVDDVSLSMKWNCRRLVCARYKIV